MSYRCLTLLGVFCAALAADGPAFDVASIKPNTSTDPRGARFEYEPSGRLVVTNLPLYMIIADAYQVPFQSRSALLSGGPEWIRSERYDIQATAALPPGLPAEARNARMRQMLQNLLAERFHLQVRHDSKRMPIYALIIGKNGPKLETSKYTERTCSDIPDPGPACHEFFGGMGRGLHAKAVTMDDLALYAQNWSDRPIVNRTALDGLYAMDTDGWTAMITGPPPPPGTPRSPEAIAMSDPARPTLFSIMNRLGLQLEPTRAAVEIIVITHIEHPTAN